MAYLLIKALPGHCVSVSGASAPSSRQRRGRELGRDGSAVQVSALATQGSLPPACCSTAPWTGLHHVVL